MHNYTIVSHTLSEIARIMGCTGILSRRLWAALLAMVVSAVVTGMSAQSLKWDNATSSITYGNRVYRMIRIDGGSFTMGATSEQTGAHDNEKPAHRVTLTPYYIGQSEVPQWLWRAVMGSNPSYWTNDDLPVEQVSWNDCVTFANKLSGLLGQDFSLPTEAQWEYAARGGDKASLYSGGALGDVGWYNGNSSKMTHPISKKRANSFGIYDMTGNVVEWCKDAYNANAYSSLGGTDPCVTTNTDGRKVQRGGHFDSNSDDCRVARRTGAAPTIKYSNIGLRLAMKEKAPQIVTFSNGAKWDPSTKTFTKGNYSYKMVYVDGGTFTMGSNDSEAGSYEKPTHQVTLSSYYIGATEVPQWLWEAVMGSNPSNWKGDRLPVECVSWDDCQSFLTRLNQKTGANFRLPTEAQWEFAARGGNRSNGYKYSGSNNLDGVAWYDGNSGGRTHEVGTKSANELGLYDMSGNVYEWCSDWYNNSYYSSSPSTNPTGPSSGSCRVIRGGCWLNSARYCRVAFRNYYSPGDRACSLGFRLGL